MQINIAGPTYFDPTYTANNNSQRSLNMYTTDPGKDGRGTGTMIPRMGYTLLLDTGKATIRGLLSQDNLVYLVADESFYVATVNIVNRTATLSYKGDVDNFVGRVEMAATSTQVFVATGTANGYIYDIEADTFEAITDADFNGAATVAQLDGYFFYTSANSSRIYGSALNDGTDYNSLDVATAEYRNDEIVKLITRKRDLWVMGKDSIEVWYDAANPTGLPLSPRIGTEMAIGCRSPRSVVEINNTIMWLDSRGFVVMAQDSSAMTNNTTGYQAGIVSTDEVATAFLSYLDTENSIACAYYERGHMMYQISFPADEKTWCYDLQTQQWHERSFYDRGLNKNTDHPGHFCAPVSDFFVIGGTKSGILYVMHPDYKTDNGEPIYGTRITQIYNQDFKMIGVDRLELRCNSGLATETGLGSDPKIMMRYSHDGGVTWSNELIRSMGKIGEYGKRVVWNRLGVGAEWVFEFKIVEPISYALIDATVDISEVEEY